MSFISYRHDLRESVRRQGAPDDVSDWIMRQARPQLRLRFQDGETDGGTTVVGYAGGRPELPDDVPWPMMGPGYATDASMEFVAAVNCSALPVEALDIPFPDAGTLLFFLDLWAYPTDTDASTIIYVPPGTGVFERERPGDSGPGPRDATPLICEPYGRLPEDHSYEFQLLDEAGRDLFLEYQVGAMEPPFSIWDGGRYDEWAPYEESVAGRMCSLVLGGPAWTVQDDPLIRRLPDHDRHRPARGTPPNSEWLLLAQLATDADGEGHIFSWTIRREDLLDRRFDQVEWHRAS